MDPVFSDYAAVENAFSSFIKALNDIQDSVQQKWVEFKQGQSVVESNIANHTQSIAGCNKISLDIGGTTFNTTAETLLKHEDTFFSAMLRWKPAKDNGQYFIDRSPDAFPLVLEYLRTGQVRTAGMTPLQREMLKSDIDFYQITSFPSFVSIRWNPDDVKDTANSLLLAGDGTILDCVKVSPKKRVIRADVSPSSVLQPAVDTNIVRWTVTVTVSGNGNVDGFSGSSVGVNGNPVVGMCTGNFHPHGGSWKPWLTWPTDNRDRVVEFSYRTDTCELTISALNGKHTRTVKLEKPPIPIVVAAESTTNVRFAISSIP
eukprot:TRINITY_DN66801_c2_g2_i1.p1 TRINITY_DN66801_c2_g2~~TRINITY_DN66801_c2_g2_i1.p1  ORF type:complete len:316 (+),score=30.70 TRINITY_DN66801_c2_g2_i1:77-1024(+)